MYVFIDFCDVVCAERGECQRLDPRAEAGQTCPHDASAEAWRGGHLFFVHDCGDSWDGDSVAVGKCIAAAFEGDGGAAGPRANHFFGWDCTTMCTR